MKKENLNKNLWESTSITSLKDGCYLLTFYTKKSKQSIKIRTITDAIILMTTGMRHRKLETKKRYWKFIQQRILIKQHIHLLIDMRANPSDYFESMIEALKITLKDSYSLLSDHGFMWGVHSEEYQSMLRDVIVSLKFQNLPFTKKNFKEFYHDYRHHYWEQAQEWLNQNC